MLKLQKRVWSLVLPLAAIGVIASCDDDPNGPSDIVYTATLSGANERPTPNSSTAVGTWTGTLNPTTNVMTYTLSFSGLSANSTGAHIHAQSDATANAPIVLNFANFAGATTAFTPGTTSGTAAGAVDLTSATTTGLFITGDSLRKAIDAGMAYVNVHSTGQFAGGEIRGQIHRQ